MTSTMSKVFCSHLVQAFIEALLGGMVHNQATPMKLIPTGQHNKHWVGSHWFWWVNATIVTPGTLMTKWLPIIGIIAPSDCQIVPFDKPWPLGVAMLSHRIPWALREHVPTTSANPRIQMFTYTFTIQINHMYVRSRKYTVHAFYGIEWMHEFLFPEIPWTSVC